jgi:hypothetical protein
MARARQSWIRPLAAAALALGACGPVPAQAGPARPTQILPSGPGSVAGKLTDLYSAPLAGVEVVLRNEATGAEVRTTTAKNGAYFFTALDAGEYTLEADSPRLGRGRLDDIRVIAGQEARVQAAMQFEPVLPAPAPLQAGLHATPPPLVQNIASQPPSMAATLAPEPLRQLPMTGQRESVPAVKAPQSAAPAQPPIRAVQTSPPVSAQVQVQPQAQAKSLQLAILKPEPAAVHPALAGAPMHAFGPLTANAPALAMSAAVASALQATIQFSLPHLSPVQAAEQEVNPVSAAVTTTVTGAEVQSLPASGRRWQEFVLDTPASAAPAGSSQAALRGSGEDPADTTIDGATIRFAFGVAASSGPGSPDSGSSLREGDERNDAGQSWNGGRGFGVSETAVREVQTVAGNVEAEGAHAAGGRTGIETQSSGNQLHGQGFFFDRQNNWGARNPFTQWVQNTGTATAPVFTPEPYTPPDHETVWGLGAGSRIRRDKLFWFAALDSYRRNDPGLATVKDPGEFFQTLEPTSPEIVLLSAQLDESLNQAYNDYLGVPTAGYTPAGLEQLDNLLGPAPRTATQWTGFARLDWKAAERHTFTLEGIGADWNSAGGGLTRVSETYGNHSFGSSRASQEWLLARWEAFVTPNLLAVTQVSAGRDILSARPDAPSAFEQGLLSGNAYGQLPQIVVDSRYGFTIGNPSRFGQGSYPDEKLYHGQEMVDWVHNSLLVKAGFEIDHNADATSLLRNQTGTYYYSKVQNFIADALAFEKFGLTNLLNYADPHNCNPANNGLGALPCYSYYSQTMGPTHWHLSTNDWAGYVTAQWQPAKLMVVSMGLRWEREQMPPPIPGLANPALPLTEKLPDLGNQWGPRVSLAIGSTEGRWPVLRVGYGMYYGRTENATLETALTQTGSFNGDLNFFIRSTDGLNPRTVTSAAPPFPYVLSGEPSTVVKPGAVEFAPNFRNPEVHQAVVSLEQSLPGRIHLTASALVSLGRRLPVAIDTNFDPSVNPGTITYAVSDKTGAGPIKAAQITVPFYATWPSATSPTGTAGRLNPAYQQISEIMSRANSTYEAAMVRISRYGRRGLSLRANYTYAHAMDWNPNETTLVAGSDVLDPENFKEEYGTSNLDVRHSAAVTFIYQAPWKLHGMAGRLANGWMVSGIGQFRSGLPYTMRVSGSLPEEFDIAGNAIVGLGPGMNGSGGDNRVYGVGRNAYRYPFTWKADFRLGKSFDLGQMRRLELLAESFNLFNHQNVTQIETTGYYIEPGSTSGAFPTLNFLTGLNNTTAFGQPLNINATNFYRERQIQLGLRMRF